MGIKVKFFGTICSFPHVFEARAIMGGKPKYSVSVVADEIAHAGTLTQLDAAVDQVIQEAFGGKSAGLKPLPLRLGAEKYPDDERFHGKVILNSTANLNQKPWVVDEDVNPVMDPAMIYGGCIINAVLDVYPYKRQTGNGITFGLLGVQWVADGEPFGDRPTAEQLFQPVAAGPDSDSLDDLI